ncbi:GTPase RsgA [Candidatus Woesearchaeota archaeon]|nr:GTPase RsgA [Candidatus Woesearchaeota archaeon]
MANYWRLVNKVIERSDILLLVLDARMINETRNEEVEYKVKQAEKPLIYAITKFDLIDDSEAREFREFLNPCVFVSVTKHVGTSRLRERILIETQRIGLKNVTVGVLGYPNVGKSSLINAMKGRKSASTSSMSGHTKGVQLVKGDSRIMFLDTPGVIPYKEEDQMKHAMIGTTDYTKVKDPDLVAMQIMRKYPGKIEKFYGVDRSEDKEITLEDIARKRNILKKRGEMDIMRAARQVLQDWQKGKII